MPTPIPKKKQPNITSGNGQSSRKETLATRADKFVLYQKSVQEPEPEVEFFTMAFRDIYGRRPLVLREDFCGTSLVSCTWVQSDSGRRAFGVDLDKTTLDWGQTNNISRLSSEEQARISLIQGDVLATTTDPADILAAQNFSFFIFKERHLLLQYFQSARNNLSSEGLFVLDMMGGSEMHEDENEEIREIDDFEYHWDHVSFDPITHDCKFNIHFSFSDGSKIENAFSYDWRLWTIPEVKELLLEAGFTQVHVYWEGADDDGEGTGEYTRETSAPADPAWVAYIVGQR